MTVLDRVFPPSLAGRYCQEILPVLGAPIPDLTQTTTDLNAFGYSCRRLLWSRYLETADEQGLLTSPAGKGLLSRLRSQNFSNFRGAIAELAAYWFLTKELGLPLTPEPKGRLESRLEFASMSGPYQLNFEVKAPRHIIASKIRMGDDSKILERALRQASKQFERGPQNVLVIVPELLPPISVRWGQLVRAFVARHEVRFPIGAGSAIRGTSELAPKGAFTKFRQGTPSFRRVSAALVLEEQLHEFVGFNHSALVVHNPYALAPVAREIFGTLPQLIVDENSDLRWTDGRELGI